MQFVSRQPRASRLLAVTVSALLLAHCGILEKKKAKAAAGGAAASSSPPPTIAPPSAPTIASATPGDAQVTVAWTPTSDGTSYNLYWNVGTAASTTATEIVNVTSPYVQVGLKNGSTYHYVLTAVSAGGESTASADVSAKPVGIIPPSPDLVDISGGDTLLTVAWQSPTTASSSYLVVRATGTTVSWTPTQGMAYTAGPITGTDAQIVYDGTALTYADTTPTNGTTYAYAVFTQSFSNEYSAPVVVSGAPEAAVAHAWIWSLGSILISDKTAPNWGSVGKRLPTNLPSDRVGAAKTTSLVNSIYLFGGTGNDSTAVNGLLGDLWSWDGITWAWLSGAKTVGETAVYGSRGTAGAANVPGARVGAASAMSGGHFWLFGGNNAADGTGYLDDLWMWNGTQWTWVSGSNATNQMGIYGTIGTTLSNNYPGSRQGATLWSDTSGNLWLFGGKGYDGSGALGALDDLWKWDGTNWTWIAGSNTMGTTPVYGTLGTANAANTPGGRFGSTTWVDSTGNFWLFSGYYFLGFDDLWKWNGTAWTFMAGNINDDTASYGTLGTAAVGNHPGARVEAANWIDGSGHLWLFGGTGNDSTATKGALNDLWEWDGTNWVWVNGANVINQPGVAVTRLSDSAASSPGGRGSLESCLDKNGGLVLFGGIGYDTASGNGNLFDTWTYSP